MEKRLLTPEEAGEILGLEGWQVLRLARSNKIRKIVVGHRTIRFDIQEVNDYIERQQNPRVLVPKFKEEIEHDGRSEVAGQ